MGNINVKGKTYFNATIFNFFIDHRRWTLTSMANADMAPLLKIVTSVLKMPGVSSAKVFLFA